jgi:hypothetical protein
MSGILIHNSPFSASQSHRCTVIPKLAGNSTSLSFPRIEKRLEVVLELKGGSWKMAVPCHVSRFSVTYGGPEFREYWRKPFFPAQWTLPVSKWLMADRFKPKKYVVVTISCTHTWCWALLEKLPIVQQLKNFPAFYGTRRFITAFTRALHWSLSWATSI